MDYSQEQQEYINYTSKQDTKLIACAGSGKTKCIISRIENLLKFKVYKPNQVLMLTFSRFTQQDFISKIEKYGAKLINHDMVRTIDSFAKHVCDHDNSLDISILSYSLLIYLRDTSPTNLAKDINLKNLKSIFVDEAQDLNNTQYNIIKFLKDKLKCIVNLVGDPNQNIYQWHGSLDKYMTEWEAKTFYLTKNFRSYQHIVEFSKYLRPNNNIQVVHNKAGTNITKPYFIPHETDEFFEKKLIEILKQITNNNKADRADIAILAPTRGYLKIGKKNNSKGLCFIANVLAKYDIPFVQYYEEEADKDAEKMPYKRIPGKVNLLTYTGSKGLEWDHVILTDAESGLINKRMFTEEQHRHDQYLLYVACTRSIKNLIIMSCSSAKGLRNFNSWFDLVPSSLYSVENPTLFQYRNLKFSNQQESEKLVTKILQSMKEEDLYNLSKKFRIINQQVVKISEDYRSIQNNHAIFLGKFAETVFKYMYCVRFGKTPPKVKNIDNIIKKTHVVYVNVSYFWNWYDKNTSISWDEYDKIRNNLYYSVINVLDRLDRQVPLENYCFSSNNFFVTTANRDRKLLTEMYAKYNAGTTYNKEMLEILFILQVASSAIESFHYYHIGTRGQKYRSTLKNYKNMFNNLWQFVLSLGDDFIIEFNKYIDNTDIGIAGEIDFLTYDNKIFEIKCVQNINLAHKLQMLIYNILYHEQINQNIILDFYNLLEGAHYTYIVESTPEEREYIINTFRRVGGLEKS